jgi:hypothetical protein
VTARCACSTPTSSSITWLHTSAQCTSGPWCRQVQLLACVAGWAGLLSRQSQRTPVLMDYHALSCQCMARVECRRHRNLSRQRWRMLSWRGAWAASGPPSSSAATSTQVGGIWNLVWQVCSGGWPLFVCMHARPRCLLHLHGFVPCLSANTLPSFDCLLAPPCLPCPVLRCPALPCLQT